MVLLGPADLRMMAAAMRPALERSRGEPLGGAPTCVVVTPTVEQALGAAEQARVILADDRMRVVPVSSVVRARRVLGLGNVTVVVGSASELLELRRTSALRLDALKAVVIIGLDDIVRDEALASLEALLGDTPDDIQRTVTFDDESAECDAFLEAHCRRARRMTPTPVNVMPLPMAPSYALTTAAGRADTLRAILDAADPPSLCIVATTDAGRREAEQALARVGVAIDSALVQVVRQPTAQHVALVVLWETPSSADALSEALAMRPVDAVALLLPDELPAFRRLTNGLAEVWGPPARKDAAENRVRQLRTALRSTLAAAGGASASELALLAPLMDTHDALEIAAAALRLYEGARRDAIALRVKVATASARSVGQTRAPVAVPAIGASSAAGVQRVFLAVGKRDSVKVGDVVGAVANEVGIPGDRIGSVELFESHATVELAADDAAKAVERLGNVTLRGRRLSARIDDRPADGARERRSFGPPRGDKPRVDKPRSDRPRSDAPRGEKPQGDRPFRGPDRADRGPRGAERSAERSGERSSERSGDRGPRAARPPRADEVRRAFSDRPVRERAEGKAEWSERGERMQHAKRERRPPDSEREPAR